MTPVGRLGQGNRNHRRARRLGKGPGERRRGSELVGSRGHMEECEGPEHPHAGCRGRARRESGMGLTPGKPGAQSGDLGGARVQAGDELFADGEVSGGLPGMVDISREPGLEQTLGVTS